MYHAHWGLRRSPFRDRPSAAAYHANPIHDEALARLHFLVDEHRRLGLVLGREGTGKTLLCQVFGREMTLRHKAVALLDLIGLSVREFYWEIAAQWGCNPRLRSDAFELFRLVDDRLREYRLVQHDCLLLLDNVDAASDEVREQVLRLALSDPAPDSRLTMVATCAADRVLHVEERLLELATLKIDLAPWDEAETIDYLCDTLRQAGCPAPPLDPEAMQRVHQLAQGVPRRVGQLADLALLAGAGDKLPQVNAATVEAVYTELGVI